MTTAEDHLFGFLRGLHEGGLRVPANKQSEFFAGIETLAPSTVGQLYWIGAATLVTSEPERHVYDDVFRRFFGLTEAPALVVTDEPADDTADEDEPTSMPGSGEAESVVADATGGSGLAASTVSPENVRRFPATTPRAHELIRELCRELPRAVPSVRSRRTRPGGRRQRVDLRAIYLGSRRTRGEIMRLYWRHRPPRSRRLLLLVDVSGSMKQHSADYLRFAYAVVATCPRAEVFTFGTRLTRVTPHLRLSDVDTALAALAEVVLDADGGTLIGTSLAAFLDDHADLARGALVLVLSDGLERGDCTAMVAATRRLSLLAAQLHWWSPLACDPAYRPLTRGMSAVLRDLDALTGVDDLDTALTAVRGKFATTQRSAHV
ncbi:VWA domain-containing protein [Asanoa sp. NPDC049518]|uniref:vWA domain-containing protein n=1 Tax=unclassified Asanoa TaxID=2685164 RepID=UPI00343E9C13